MDPPIIARCSVMASCGCIVPVFEWRGGVRETWRGNTVELHGIKHTGVETVRFENGQIGLSVPPGTPLPWPCAVPVFWRGDPYVSTIRVQGGCAAHRPVGLPLNRSVLAAFKVYGKQIGIREEALQELVARGDSLHGLEFAVRVAPRLAADPCLEMLPVVVAALGIKTVGVADGWGGGGPYDVHVALVRNRVTANAWEAEAETWGREGGARRITADDEQEAAERSGE